MPDINAQFPIKGINEGEAFSAQPPQTTREAVNVQAADPQNGRSRGVQRAGLSLYNTSQLGSGQKVAELAHVVYDNNKTTWSLQSTDITLAEWEKEMPGKGDCKDIAVDRQNNIYTTDLTSTIVKVNSAGNIVYSIAVPVSDQGHLVKSLCVDDSDYIFCGVSDGGDQTTAKIFAYEQLETDKSQRVWDLVVGMYAKRMLVKNGLLSIAFDDTRQQRSYVHVYDAIQTGVPLLKAYWEVPYPVNDMAISGKDGGLVTAHEPNPVRGTSQTSPGTTASSVDWTPPDLPNWSKRAWCWLDATDIDGDGTFNSAYQNGEEILQWTDKTGNSRNLYQNTDAVSGAALVTDRPPTLLKKVVAGRDAVAFNGTDQSMMSGGNSSTVSSATTQSLRGQNLSILPSEQGAQFAMFIVFRAPQEAVIRCLLSQDDGTTHNFQTSRGLLINRNGAARHWLGVDSAGAATPTTHTNWFGPDEMPGNINWTEQLGIPTGATNQYSAPSTQVNGVTSDDPTGTRITGTTTNPGFTVGNYNTISNLLGFRPAAGSTESDYCLVCIVNNGGDPMVASATTNDRYHCQLWVNGRLIDLWRGRPDRKYVFPVYVGWTRATAPTNAQYRFRGLICEMLVLSDWYDTQTSPFDPPTRKVPCTTEHNDSSFIFPGASSSSYNGSSYYQSPVVSNVTWNNHGMERVVIEGYLAHKWGMAHLLPAGKWAHLKAASGASASSWAGGTVKIDNTIANTLAVKTYTFVGATSAFTVTANEVRVGAGTTGKGMYDTTYNLYSAINKTGTAGTATGTTGQYDQSVEAAANCIALPPTCYMTTTDLQPTADFTTSPINFYMVIRSKSLTLTEFVSSSGTVTEFDSSYSGVDWASRPGDISAEVDWQFEVGGDLRGAYRRNHFFYLNRPFKATVVHPGSPDPSYDRAGVSYTCGGPPRKDGKRLSQPYQCFSAKDGIVAKWDASSGRLSWALHSRIDGDADAPFGGLGYGVASSSTGTLCCVGPEQDSVSVSPPYNPTTASDAYKLGGTLLDGKTIRTIIDNGPSYTTTAAAGCWSKGGSTDGFYELDYKYPRLASDYWGNFYVPWLDLSGLSNKDAFVVVDESAGTVLHTIEMANKALCAAASSANIDYTPGVSLADSRAQYVVFGCRTENRNALGTTSTQPNDGDTITLKQGNNDDTQKTYRFKNTLAAINDVKIQGNADQTLASFAKAINGTGVAGTDYYSGTTAHADLFCEIQYATGSSTDITILSLHARNPAPTGDVDASITTTTSSALFDVSNVTVTLTSNLKRIKLVNSNPGTGTTRNFINVGVCGGAIKTFDDTSVVTSVTGGAFDSANSDFYQSAVLFQKVYITNGQQTLVYDPKLGTASELKSTTGGEVPKRCKLIASWRARLVLARSSDSPHNWFMSAIGEPTNWDLFPKVVNAGQAIAGTISKAGLVPDVINSLVPYNDDLLIIGGDHSIYRLTGDPMAGGQMDMITDVTGMAFGHSWDKDPQGNLYFVSPRGGLYVMSPGKRGLVEISNSRFEQRLSEIDLTSNYVRVVWNDLERQLHIFVMPYGAGGTHLKHFRWERDNNAFWQDEFGPATGVVNATAVQPTSAIIIDGDAPGDRHLLIGGEDGRVRKWDKDSRKDQINASTSWPIDSQVVMGPYGAPDAEIRLTMIQAVLASDRQRAGIQIYSSDSPDRMGDMVWSGTLSPGRNPNIFARAKGSYFWIRLRNAWPDETWAFESLVMRVAKAGRKRVRP